MACMVQFKMEEWSINPMLCYQKGYSKQKKKTQFHRRLMLSLCKDGMQDLVNLRAWHVFLVKTEKMGYNTMVC